MSSHAVPRQQVLFTSVSRVISTPLSVPLRCWPSALGFVSWPPSFGPPGPSLPSLSGLLNDHLCCRGRRGASCRALVRPSPASWHAAFSVAQFGQTMVTQFWAQRCHVKEPQTAPAKRSDSQIRSTLHCEYKQGRISSDPSCNFCLLFRWSDRGSWEVVASELQRRAVAQALQHELMQSTPRRSIEIEFPAHFLPRAAISTFAGSFPQRHPIS